MGVLRLLLALSVVIAHVGEIFHCNLVGGKIAVQAFYIISGFYMTLILNEKYIGKNKSYFLFITNRLIRLYPIYWVVLLLTVSFYLIVGFFGNTHTFPIIDNYFLVESNFVSFLYLILTNIFIVGQDIIMFLGISPESGNLYFTTNFYESTPPLYKFLLIPQAWTLGVEIAFYLIAPLFLRNKASFITVLCIASLGLRLFIYNYLNLQNDPWTYRFFPTELLFFLLGYFSYQLYFKIKKKTISNYINISILLIIVVFTLVYSSISNLKIDYFPFMIKEIVYFISITLSIPFLFKFLKNHSLDNKIGELSYPVYISHILVSAVLFYFPFGTKMSLMIVLVTILFSFLLNYLIANPLEKFRQSRVKTVK